MNRRVYEWLAARLAVALLAALMAAGCTREEQTPPIDATETPGSTGASGAEEAKMTPSELAGTNWQLVRIASMDDSVSEPDERSHYTIRFDPDGRAAIRADCNRGNGTWKAEGAKLAFGPIALTRAMCPPGSLHDSFVSQLSHVRSYVIEDGALHLATMADGAILDFEPVSD